MCLLNFESSVSLNLRAITGLKRRFPRKEQSTFACTTNGVREREEKQEIIISVFCEWVDVGVVVV